MTDNLNERLSETAEVIASVLGPKWALKIEIGWSREPYSHDKASCYDAEWSEFAKQYPVWRAYARTTDEEAERSSEGVGTTAAEALARLREGILRVARRRIT